MPQEYVAIEPYLSGSYKKFNSNGGYENDISKLLPAFCHWTWEISGHKFMVRQQIYYYISCKFDFKFALINPSDYGIWDITKTMNYAMN